MFIYAQLFLGVGLGVGMYRLHLGFHLLKMHAICIGGTGYGKPVVFQPKRPVVDMPEPTGIISPEKKAEKEGF